MHRAAAVPASAKLGQLDTSLQTQVQLLCCFEMVCRLWAFLYHDLVTLLGGCHAD